MATTLANLRTAIRIELRDADGVTWNDEKVDYAANQAYRLCFLRIASAVKDYFVTTANVNIVSGTRAYALPSDHITTKLLEYVESSRTYPIHRYTRGAGVNYTAGSLGAISGAPYFTYDLEGTNFVLEPTPQQSVTSGIKHTYYAGPSALTGSSSAIHANFKDAWVDVITLEACKALLSQIEAMGGFVSDEFNDRLKRAWDVVEKSMRVREISPRVYPTKGYFE